MGFSDARLAELAQLDAKDVRSRRSKAGVWPVYKRIDTCAAEFSSETAYMYSTYEITADAECEADPSDRQKIVILGAAQTELVRVLNLTIAVFTPAMRYRTQGTKQS